jgi:ankyrin repeat protein
MLAAEEGHAEVVKLLVAAGADVHVKNKVGKLVVS